MLATVIPVNNNPDTPEPDSIQSLGGKARAESLTPEQRKEIASAAATARWAHPKAGWEGDLVIGKIAMKCAVVLDEKQKPIRVISETEFMRALGMYRSGALSVRREQDEAGAQTPLFLAYKNLKPFVEKTLGGVHYRPLKVIYKNGSVGHGITADTIPTICEIWMDARKAGVLGKRQEKIADLAEIIHRGLARVGIEALVDEATGYQYDRARDALGKILEKFIAKELQPWTRAFPMRFYEDIFRLRKWPFNPDTMTSPRVLGKYTNNIVYARLAPGVLEELRRKTPVIDGRRKHKLYRWLTGEVGHPKLMAHFEALKVIMGESKTWEEFMKKLDKYYPIIETTELGFEIEISS
jgi:hypothetical protein